MREGDRVQVLGFSEAFVKSLLPVEHARISQMIGDVVVAEEIDDGGQAGITKWWKLRDRETHAHEIGLAPSEMELTSRAGQMMPTTAVNCRANSGHSAP